MRQKLLIVDDEPGIYEAVWGLEGARCFAGSMAENCGWKTGQKKRAAVRG